MHIEGWRARDFFFDNCSTYLQVTSSTSNNNAKGKIVISNNNNDNIFDYIDDTDNNNLKGTVNTVSQASGIMRLLILAAALAVVAGPRPVAAARSGRAKGRRIHYRAGSHTIVVTKEFDQLWATTAAIKLHARGILEKNVPGKGVAKLNENLFGRIVAKGDALMQEMESMGIHGKNMNRDTGNGTHRGKRSIDVLGDMWKALAGSPNKEDLTNIEGALQALQETDVAEGEEMATIIEEQQQQLDFNNRTIEIEKATAAHMDELDKALKGQRVVIEVVGSMLATAAAKDALLEDIAGAVQEIQEITDPLRARTMPKKLLNSTLLKGTLLRLSERGGKVPIWTAGEAEGYFKEGMSNIKMMEGKVVAALNIPLIDKSNRYYLHETPVGKIVLEERGRSYRYLQEKDMTSCRDLYTGELLCDLRRVVIHDTSDVCVDPFDCVTGKTLPYSYVKEMEEGIFTYRFPEEALATITCGNISRKEVLNKTGILVMEESCAIASKNFYIDPVPDREEDKGEAELIHWTPAFADEDIDIQLTRIVEHHNDTRNRVAGMEGKMEGMEKTMGTEIQLNTKHREMTNETKMRVDRVERESKAHWIGSATVLPILAVVVALAVGCLACRMCSLGKGIASVASWMQEVKERSRLEQKEARRRKRMDALKRDLEMEKMKRQPPTNPSLSRPTASKRTLTASASCTRIPETIEETALVHSPSAPLAAALDDITTVMTGSESEEEE